MGEDFTGSSAQPTESEHRRTAGPPEKHGAICRRKERSTYELHLDEVAAAAADDSQQNGAALLRHYSDGERVTPRVRQLEVGK